MATQAIPATPLVPIQPALAFAVLVELLDGPVAVSMRVNAEAVSAHGETYTLSGK